MVIAGGGCDFDIISSNPGIPSKEVPFALGYVSSLSFQLPFLPSLGEQRQVLPELRMSPALAKLYSKLE
jgi:hypothetical protein